MINQCIYLYLIIKIFCNYVRNNDTCINCSNNNQNYYLKKIFIIVCCLLGIIFLIFLLILFYRKFMNLFSNNINNQSGTYLKNDKLIKKKYII